jgi:DNA-directed RNA polymerase subunit RPC12/RpoP
MNYSQLHGAQGHIYCLNCAYIHLINVNWFKWNLRDGKPGIRTSYQCLTCGSFNSVDLLQGEQVGRCSCGGELSQRDQLFCPSCKSKALSYKLYFFT